MSDETALAMEAAIEAHIADETSGDLAGGYVVVVETTSMSEMDAGRSAYFIATRNAQSRFMTDGLLWTALRTEGDDDDD